MSGFFVSIASNDRLLKFVDFLNEWGLLLIGLGLILGIFNKLSCYAGMIILALYYLSHPPFLGIEFAFPTEGNYLIVDKNLIELIALGTLALLPTSQFLGLDRLLYIKTLK